MDRALRYCFRNYFRRTTLRSRAQGLCSAHRVIRYYKFSPNVLYIATQNSGKAHDQLKSIKDGIMTQLYCSAVKKLWASLLSGPVKHVQGLVQTGTNSGKDPLTHHTVNNTQRSRSRELVLENFRFLLPGQNQSPDERSRSTVSYLWNQSTTRSVRYLLILRFFMNQHLVSLGGHVPRCFRYAGTFRGIHHGSIIHAKFNPAEYC